VITILSEAFKIGKINWSKEVDSEMKKSRGLTLLVLLADGCSCFWIVGFLRELFEDAF
jgi:hypothetical protein